jgi:hypothetical protein
MGVLLGLGDGSLRFFRNGARHGPSYAAGSVTGPVVAAFQMWGQASTCVVSCCVVHQVFFASD